MRSTKRSNRYAASCGPAAASTTEELGAKYDTTEIPDDLKDKAQEYHEKLVEAAAEADGELMNKFFGRK